MKTRIKIASSCFKTEYMPQYKGILGWVDMQGVDAPVKFYKPFLEGIGKGYEPKSLELAQYMIDRAIELDNLSKLNKKHNKEAKTTYVKYP